MDITRRHFVQRAAAFSAGFAGLSLFNGGSGTAMARSLVDPGSGGTVGYGPLVPDPKGMFDLPEGFTYEVISRFGAEMSDGLLTPGLHDGMAAFPGLGERAGKTILICNHEIEQPLHGPVGPFGAKGERLDKIAKEALFDAGPLAMGGTTTLIYDTQTKRVEREFLSLAGTSRNCAGGPTPWNSWLTCEETVARAGDGGAGGLLKDHGWVFEVPSTSESVVLNPQPLKAMGRFNHEAVCVDPRTGIVYLTEDREDGLIYRFLPKTRGRLAEGGRLQALKIKGTPRARLRNWGATDAQAGGADFPTGTAVEVEWIDLRDIEAPQDDLRVRGFEAGAAMFARGEGMWFGKGAAYWACTNGGRKKLGQIWKYEPSPSEGSNHESDQPGRLTLLIESTDSSIIANADNITVAPWGDLIGCEDNAVGVQHLFGVTPAGKVYRLGKNSGSKSELAGATFSPDGSTLFVNLQRPGATLAISGPWSKRLGEK